MTTTVKSRFGNIKQTSESNFERMQPKKSQRLQSRSPKSYKYVLLDYTNTHHPAAVTDRLGELAFFV